MRFDRPISYNGWTAAVTTQAGGRPTSGFLVDEFRPQPVPGVGYLDKRALQDGVDAGDVFLGPRQFTAVISVFGSSWGDFWDKADELQAAFSPTLAYDADSSALGFLPFDFIQPTADTATWDTGTYPYGIPMRYYLRPASSPDYSIRRDEVGGVAGGGISRQFTVPLLAKDPRKYLQDARSLTLTTSNQTATYRGNYSSLPVITFSLTASGSSALTFTIDSNSVVIDVSGQSSGTFDLDYANRTLIKSPSTALTGLIDSATYVAIGPGSVVRRANDTGLSSGFVTYREAWV